MSPAEISAFSESHQFFAHDFMSEEHMREVLGDDYINIYRQSQCDRYHVLNYLCALGGAEKMYSAPLIDEKRSWAQNQVLFERRMIEDFRSALTPGRGIVDLGCGRGTVSLDVWRRTGHKVTGVNIDPTQVEIARNTKMKGGCPNEFVVADFNNSETFNQFDRNSFDVAYQIQSLSCVHDKPRFFRDVNRCMRLGGRYAILCYVRHPHYDRDNPVHLNLMVKTKQIMAAIYSPLVSEYEQWLTEAGFEVVHSEDLSVKDGMSSIVLYEKIERYFNACERWVSRLAKCRLAPRRLAHMLQLLGENSEEWYEADGLRLVSPTWYLVADKVRDVEP